MDKNKTPESIEGVQTEEYVAVILPDKTIKLVPLDDYNKSTSVVAKQTFRKFFNLSETINKKENEYDIRTRKSDIRKAINQIRGAA